MFAWHCHPMPRNSSLPYLLSPKVLTTCRSVATFPAQAPAGPLGHLPNGPALPQAIGPRQGTSLPCPRQAVGMAPGAHTTWPSRAGSAPRHRTRPSARCSFSIRKVRSQKSSIATSGSALRLSSRLPRCNMEEWVFFENDLAQCQRNIEQRNRSGMQAESRRTVPPLLHPARGGGHPGLEAG